MFSGYSLAWQVPQVFRDAPQRTISAMQPLSKTPQAPRQQPFAGRCGSSKGRAAANRRKPSEVGSGPRQTCKMHYELPGGNASCKRSPAQCARKNHQNAPTIRPTPIKPKANLSMAWPIFMARISATTATPAISSIMLRLFWKMGKAVYIGARQPRFARPIVLGDIWLLSLM